MSGRHFCDEPNRMVRYRRVAGRRQGLSVIYVGIIFVILLGFVGFAVDVGRMRLARNMLQTSADSGACAGASNLPVGTNQAYSAAKTYGEKNPFVDYGSNCSIDTSQDVVLGLWDPVKRQFHKLPYTDSLGQDHVIREANACSVTGKALNARNNSIKLYFAPVFGLFTNEVPGMLATAYITGGQRTFGIVGLDYIKANGNTVTFDSALPPLYAQRNNGSIASNGNIDLGNGDVYGDVRPGQGKDIIQGPQSDVTGWMAPMDQPLSFANATVPAGAQTLSVPKNKPVSISGSGSSTNPKDFVVNGNWSTNDVLTVSGYSAVYVTGKLDLTGASITGNTTEPQRLRIYMVGSGTVDIGGSSKQYFELYAPQSAVTIHGTPGFYGSIIGKSIDMKGTAALHYDESLPGLPLPWRMILVE